MNALLLLLATMIAGCLTFTLGGYEVPKDIDVDDEEAQQLLNIITKPRKPKDYHVVYETAFGSLQSHFGWNDCGSSSDVAHIKSFSLSPDPLRLPGNITVGFTWETTEDLKAPITLNLKLQKKIGFLWITIPCSFIPGGCHRDDLCATLAPITCPTDYETCHCPLKKGTYTLPPTTISVPLGGIPSGDYRLTAWLNQGSTEFGCFNTQLAIN